MTDFYRATLCVSPVFAVGRCLSVRPSVTFVYCIQTAEDILNLLSRHSISIILVFRPRAPVHNSKEKPFSGGAKHTGVGKFCDFRLVSPFISETAWDRAMDMER